MTLLTVLRRPAPAAALPLVLIVVLILLSRFKQDILLMSANFIDVLLIDADIFSFLLTVFPGLRWKVGLAAAVVVPLIALLWWIEPIRVRRRVAALGAIVCAAALAGLSLAVPMDRERSFEGAHYVSQFAHSGVLALYDLTTHGLLDPMAVPATAWHRARRRPANRVNGCRMLCSCSTS